MSKVLAIDRSSSAACLIYLSSNSSAKIAYLAFQQNIEEEQLFIEEQVGLQLGLAIELEFPVSLENELLSDTAKDVAVNIQPNETTAWSGQ